MEKIKNVVEGLRNYGKDVPLCGLETGIKQLDLVLGGLREQSLTVIGGRPSMGKTALLIDILYHVAVEQGKTCVVFAIEDGPHMFTKRLLERAAHLNNKRVTDVIDVDSIQEDALRIEKSKIYISSEADIIRIKEKCRKVMEKDQVDLIIIDKLQYAYMSNQKTHKYFGYLSPLKDMAREYNCPVIVSSQLKRKIEKRKFKWPMLGDLRVSCNVATWADSVILLYRDEYYNKDSKEKNTLDLYVPLNKWGNIGTCKVDCRMANGCIYS